MKKKIIFGVTACFFAAVTMLNISFSRQDNISDISLKNIEAMAQDNIEPITPIGYYGYYYPGTGSWCCFSGSSACISSNC